MEFTGKTALITGSSGIGLGVALRLARGGATVHLCGIEAARNDEARVAATGLPVTVHQTDVADEKAVEKLVAKIMQTAPGIDILVNAAGIQTYGTVMTTTVAEWDRVMNVNLRSYFLTSHFVYPHMKPRGAGAIVHVSSVQGHANQCGVLGYATTKGGVHALTRAMAVDCARDNITVNSVSPGSIRTPLLEYGAAQLAQTGQSVDDVIAASGAAHPIGRVGTIDEVADLIAFLVSAKAGFCTGGDYRIDGGLTAALGV